MAVAGLQNVSVLDSPLSRQWGNHDRPSTQASSVLQMWREIEDEQVVSSHSQFRVGDRLQHQRIDNSNTNHVNTFFSEKQDGENGDDDANQNANECQTWSQDQLGFRNEHEEVGNGSSSEQSADFGEVERGRVRQIFEEWTNSGVRGHASNVSIVNSYSRVQWLGENECERVRIVREWVRKTSQPKGTFGGSREEQPAEIGAQIERVRDGLVANHCEVGARRNIRRLCGRQALLDLLARAERERQRELQNLLEHRPVSDFAHRNRINSLLKGRFLQSGRLVQDKRPSSMSASELGLLQQRHTVSDLREEFLSRLDNVVHGPSSNAQSDTSSNRDINDFINEQPQTNSSLEVLNAIQEQSDPCNGEGDTNELFTVPVEGNLGQDINWPEVTAAPDVQQVGIFENEEREQLLSSNSVSFGSRNGSGGNVGVDCSENCWQEVTAPEEWQAGIFENEDIGQLFSSNSPFGRRNVLEENTGRNGVENITNESEELHEHFELNGEEHDVHVSSYHADGHDINSIGIDCLHASSPVENWQESIIDNEDSDRQHTVNIEFTGWNTEGIDGNWIGGPANYWYQETLGSEGAEHNHLQEVDEGWHDNSVLEAMDNLIEEPSAQQAAPVGRFDTFYFPDDDNVANSEIRELLSRRSVSNLLQSDFRESLNQLIQSYVERQAHDSVNWELDGTSSSPSSPALVEQDLQQSGGQNQGQMDAAQTAPLGLPSPPGTPFQPFWEHEFHDDDNWPRNNLHQHLGIEWEIINDLRTDMARLQQRMDNMQRMLEACMDMQLELQRSVRQEVSAALNRSAGSPESVDSFEEDESKWDHVRKGICCICRDSSIDSLLYRCGHMCTCSKCADKLVQGRGKCPMCRAPVAEMIRAYSIQ